MPTQPKSNKPRLLIIAAGLLLLGVLSFAAWPTPQSTDDNEVGANSDARHRSEPGDHDPEASPGNPTERPSPAELPKGWENHRLEIRFDGETVTLEGTMPSEEEADDLVGMAQGTGEVVDRLEILDEDAPPTWYEAAQVALGILEELEQGVVTLTADELHVTGRSSDGGSLDEIEETVKAQLEPHYTVSIDIEGASRREIP